MNTQTVRERNLRRLLKESGETADQFAKLVGTNPSYISQILSRKSTKTLGDRLARKIERALSLPAGWMEHESHEPADEVFFVHDNSNSWCVPTEWAEKMGLNPESLRLVLVKGDAMAPTLPH